jgi:glucose-1-phosphate cytidylyltransferase
MSLLTSRIRNTQVVILCGGMGTRIRDVAEDIPKPMIPVGNHPILWHVMKGYARFGFRRFILCLGYKSWVIKHYFLDYHLAQSDLTVELSTHSSVRVRRSEDLVDWEVTLAETGLETMTGGRVKAIERYIEGDHFMLTYGDGVSDVDLHALLEFHLRHDRIGTVTAVHAPGRFGEMELDGPLVTAFSEKPPVSRGRINGGFFVFKREFLGRLGQDRSLVLEREPLEALVADGELVAFPHDGFWHCMDNSRDYQYLNQLCAERKAVWAVAQPTTERLAA